MSVESHNQRNFWIVEEDHGELGSEDAKVGGVDSRKSTGAFLWSVHNASAQRARSKSDMHDARLAKRSGVGVDLSS
jgi:hypothetical protein